MMPEHHLADETLQDYAAGVLSSSMETLIACHLTLCPHCRERANLCDSIGGNMLNTEQPAAMSAGYKDVLIRANKQDVSASQCAVNENANLAAVKGVPAPLARLLPTSIDNLPWRTVAPGIKQYNLTDRPRKEGAFKLFSAEPGTAFSQHTHEHRELTFVLSGSYTDELGWFKAGDISDLDEKHLHSPVVNSDVPCVSLIATDAPVRFSGLVGKIVQPFVGI